MCDTRTFFQTNLRLNSSKYILKHVRCKIDVITHAELSNKIRTLTEKEFWCVHNFNTQMVLVSYDHV
jgi:hypothetical protein